MQDSPGYQGILYFTQTTMTDNGVVDHKDINQDCPLESHPSKRRHGKQFIIIYSWLIAQSTRSGSLQGFS